MVEKNIQLGYFSRFFDMDMESYLYVSELTKLVEENKVDVTLIDEMPLEGF